MLNNLLADRIVARIVSRLPAVDISSDVTSFDTAYELQDLVAEKLVDSFGKVAGYKIAWNNAAQISQLAPNAPAVGHVFGQQVYPTGKMFDDNEFKQLVVEPEIIAVIATDIEGDGHTAQTVLSKIARYHAGFEIMDRRGCTDATLAHPPSIVANNIFNFGLILGQGIDAEEVDFSTLVTVVNLDGAEILNLKNAAPQNPVEAVATVANSLAKRGKMLRAGDLVLCGTHLPPVEVRRGALRVTMGALGEARFDYGSSSSP